MKKGKIIQETRLFDPNNLETRSMRGKEESHDYRYFPDPDLPPLVLNEDDIEKLRLTSRIARSKEIKIYRRVWYISI